MNVYAGLQMTLRSCVNVSFLEIHSGYYVVFCVCSGELIFHLIDIINK